MAGTLVEHVRRHVAAAQRWAFGLTRPSGAANARRLRARGESVHEITCRDATATDIPALARLHVETWNATYRTTRGPTVAVRTHQWTGIFAVADRVDFVVVLVNARGELVGFTWGTPHEGAVPGELSKIYLRWDYHGLGLGRRLLAETARRFLERGIDAFILFAELTNPTLGFYERMGGERLLNERGLFDGAYVFRNVAELAAGGP